MSAHREDEPLDLWGPDQELARKRFQERLRAAGITPATEWEWEDPSERVVVRAPSRLRTILRSLFRIR